MSICSNLKTEYESLQRLADEYSAVYLRVRDSGDFTEAKQLKKELQQKRDALKNKFSYPIIVRGSIERIIKELNLNVGYEVDDKGKVEFKHARKTMGQIVSILTHKKNRVGDIDIGWSSIGSAGAQAIAEVLKHSNNKVTSMDLRENLIRSAGAKVIAEALKHSNNKITYMNLWGNGIDIDGTEAIKEAVEEIKKIGREIKVDI
ncbi:MAG: hypothetical protein HYW78_04110 [Parcubacteria group bacterium]|nr:hypothetical protein [Parcubacteria group bacterium]